MKMTDGMESIDQKPIWYVEPSKTRLQNRGCKETVDEEQVYASYEVHDQPRVRHDAR